MTGPAARALWAAAAEPARRELAKRRDGLTDTDLTLAVETLGGLRLALCEAVVREEDGVLGEIASEWAGLRAQVP